MGPSLGSQYLGPGPLGPGLINFEQLVAVFQNLSAYQDHVFINCSKNAALQDPIENAGTNHVNKSRETCFVHGCNVFS